MLKVIVIDRQGKTSLWNDAMAGDGKVVARARASNIETCSWDPSKWVIRFTNHPRNGHFAGTYIAGADDATPWESQALRFDKHEDAVSFEIDFISRHILLRRDS